jgi:hypothetical protein
MITFDPARREIFLKNVSGKKLEFALSYKLELVINLKFFPLSQISDYSLFAHGNKKM